MKHSLVFSLVAVTLLTAGVASAQTYYPYSAPNQNLSCVSLTHHLTRGSSDAQTNGEVSKLQRFLVSQNYPGGGAWMITGYFGSGTEQAVRNFQNTNGIVATGAVGPATRDAIQRQTCGNSFSAPTIPTTAAPTQTIPQDAFAFPFNTSNSFFNYLSTTFPYLADYFQSFKEPVASNIVQINQLTPNFGGVGDQVTIWGTGFSSAGNAVHFGNGVIANIRSFDGRSLTFEVPSELKGFGNRPIELATYNVSVVNERGQRSNAVQFNVTSLSKTNTSAEIISVTGPASVTVGIPSTWTVLFGTQSLGNVTTTVHWGDGSTPTTQITQINSIFQQSQSFTHAYSAVGTYTITVEARSAFGKVTTKTLAVTVTESIGGGSGNVIISSLSPSQGQAGVQIVIQGTGFTSQDNTVHFGIGGTRNLVSTDGGTKIFYTIPHFISPCDLIVGVCNAPATQVTSGTYPIFVTNASGSTGAVNFLVIQ